MSNKELEHQETYSHPQLARNAPVQLKQGVYSSVTTSRDIYDSIPYLSSSVLKQWIKVGAVPSKFGFWLENRWKEEPSEALVLGQALDCRLLEPVQFPFRFCTVPPNSPRRVSLRNRLAKKPSPETVAAITFWDKFEEENKGKHVLDTEQMVKVTKMEAALKKARCAAGVFEFCQKSVLIGEFNGWPAKAEIDLWDANESNEHIFDLKTARDCGPNGFGYACDQLGYIEQAVFYLAVANSLGFKKTAFTWVVVESEEPYAVQVYTLDPINFEKHSELYNAAMVNLTEAHKGLTSALLEGIYEDDADWKPVQVPDYAQIRARKVLESI